MERDLERPELIGVTGGHADGPRHLAVECHQPLERRRAVRLRVPPPGQRGHVDRVVEVRMADQDARDLVRLGTEHPVVKVRVGERRPVREEGAQRNAGDVRVDVEGVALVGQAIAGHAQPPQIQPVGERQRPVRQLFERQRVVTLAPVAVGDEAREAGQVPGQANGGGQNIADVEHACEDYARAGSARRSGSAHRARASSLMRSSRL